MSEDLKYLERKIIPILKRNDVEFAAVFGSRVRGEARLDSDVDILVRFSAPVGLYDFIGLEQNLSEVLDRKVDLVSEESVHPYIKSNVAKDLKVLYGKRRYI